MSIEQELVLHKKTFQELTVDELYELLRVRSEVFVVEQDCVYQDMDGDDQNSIHLWLSKNSPCRTSIQQRSIIRTISTRIPRVTVICQNHSSSSQEKLKKRNEHRARTGIAQENIPGVDGG